MKENSNRKQNKGGRTPKTDPSIHRPVFRLTDEETPNFYRFLKHRESLIKQSLSFPCCSVRKMKSVKIEKGTVDFYMRLTSFHSQFRAIGVNYNQITKLLCRHFSNKKRQRSCTN